MPGCTAVSDWHRNHGLGNRVGRENEARAVVLVGGQPGTLEPSTALFRFFGYLPVAVASLDQFDIGALAGRPAALVVASPDAFPAIADWLGAAPGRGPAVHVGPADDIERRVAAVRAGCTAFVPEPATPLALLDAIERGAESEGEAPFRVLVVDDTSSDAQLHAALLRRAGMTALALTDARGVPAALAEFQPELVLMDYYMPRMTGVEVAAAIRQEPGYQALPIAFLSVEDDVEKQRGALENGGDDFLMKPIDPDRLIAAVHSRARRFRRLRGLITRDTLTGLLNHSSLFDALGREVARALQNDHDLAYALVDVDHFKKINDGHGHATGDLVLRVLARLFKRRFRRTDVIGRVGGEEFAVILPGMNADAAARQIDALRADLADLALGEGAGRFGITISAGIAALGRFPAPTQLNAAADRALYAAKHAGRNRVAIATD